MTRRFSIISYVLLVLLSVRVRALAQVYPFRTYTTQNGLISNTINDMFQDSRGYLWIATFDGLSLYDGNSFTNYTSLDGLAHHLPWCVTESRRVPGTLFIGTNGGGISQFTDGRFSTIRLGPNREENEVSDVVEDYHGSLWCLTNAGLVVLADSVPTRLQLQNTYASRSLALASDSIVWIAENNTLYRFASPHRLLSRVSVPLRGGAVVNSLYADRQGNVWVAGSDSSIFVYRDTIPLLRRRLSEGMPGQMLIDRQNNVWMAVSHRGVLRIARSQVAGGAFEHLTTANGLHSNDVTALLLDREENLWFGSFDSGVALLTERGVLRFVEPKPSGTGLGIDSRNRTWTATESAVMECWNDGTHWRTAVHPVAPMGTTIRSMMLDRTDRLWVVLTDNSIRAYEMNAGTSSSASRLKPQMTLRAGIHFPKAAPFLCFVDRNGFLWYTIEPRSVGIINLNHTPQFEKLLTYPDQIPVPAIRAVYQDARGNMWFGGFAEGLAMLPRGDWQKERMRKLKTADGLPDDGVRSIAEDDSGRLWVGTRYGGLAIYDGSRFRTFTARDGLLSNAIWSVARGIGDTMWLGTSLGLMHIESREPYRTKWNQELIRNDTRLVRVDRNGRVWSVEGGVLTLYEPLKHTVNAVPPPIHLSQVTLNGKPVPVQHPLELSHDQNNITLQFIGVSFKGGVRYRYRLKGAAEAWSAPSPQREVSYAALSPGSYTFEVLAVNHDGIESTSPASLSFTILPPFWRRAWFLLVAGLLLAGAFGGVVRYVSTQKLKRRVQELETERAVRVERERTRERIARDLHDDVASTLGSVVIYAESLKRQAQTEAETAHLAERISELSQQAQDAIGDIVWSTSPQHDSLADVITRIKDIVAAVCTACNISYTITVEGTLPALPLPEEVRKNLFLILKESLNNIVKHAQASAVSLLVEVSNDLLRVVLADNGKGYDPSKPPSHGHGLRNMRARAQAIGATLDVRSEVGGGTSIDLRYRMT